MNENTLEIAAFDWFDALGCEVRRESSNLMSVCGADTGTKERV